MAGSISIPLPAFSTSFPDPIKGNLTIDGKKIDGNLTIDPGVKIDGVQGSQTTIGGFSSSVTVKDGKASFSGKVNILKQSYTFKNGETLALQASISVDEPLRYTVKLTGTDTVSKALTFDQNDSDKLPKGKALMTGSITLMEDPFFKEAGIFIPGYTKFKRWTEKLTITVEATLEDEAGREKTSKTASLTRTIQWALRPLFEKRSRDDPPSEPPSPIDPPSPPFPPLDPDWSKIKVEMALPALLFLFQSGYQSQILQQIPRQYVVNLSEEMSSSISSIQKTAFSAINDVSKAKEAVDQLETASKELTQGIEAAEEEAQVAETGIEAAEAGIETAEGALAAAESAETAAAAEVATATAAEVAADASEAADWWTIIGGIASAAAIAVATAALAAAITKHNKTVKEKQQAQANFNQNKKDLGKQQLGNKQAETKKAHLGDELKATQKELKTAEKYKQDKQDVRDILEAAHVGLENMQKQIKKEKN